MGGEVMLYAQSTGGFYHIDIHEVIPSDAVSITAQEYAALLDSQASGKLIAADEQGRPVLVDPPQEPVVPLEVTMRQARLALSAAGKLAAVDAAIASLPEPQKSAAQIEWEYSAAVRRTQPLVLALAPAIDLSEEQLDALFIQAAAL
jgi:hypothetical protein